MSGTSNHEFDRWFMGSVADLHAFDLSGAMPPLAARRI